MNSLEQLNNFSTDLIDYGDEADYSISLLNLGPQNFTVLEGQSHTAKLGVEIIEIVSGPPTIFLEFDLTAANGNAQLTWPTLPDGVIATNPEPNVYRLTGVSTLLIWSLVKSPTITLTRDYDQSFVYVGEFNGGQGNVVTWNVDLTVVAQAELNTLSPNGIEFQEDITVEFGSNTIQIVDSEVPDSGYVLTGTFSIPNVGTITGLLTPSVYYQQFPDRIELSGLREAINGFLANMSYVPYTDFDQSFTIVWQLTNPVSGLVTTTNPQNVTCVATNEEIANINFSRSYTQNQYGLLFPFNTPYIIEDVPNAVYTISMQIDADIGVIGFGENLITPANWNELTKTFLYQSKSKAEINSMFQNVKFFPYTDITSSATITYRQGRNGQTTVVEAFSLTGQPFTTKITATNAIAMAEDGSTATQITEIYPNWDTPGFSVLLQNQFGGVPSTAVGAWNSYSGWQYVGSAQTHSGIYKNFPEAATLTEFENFITDVESTRVMTLTPDYDQNFTLVRAVNYGGTYNGSEFLGGDTYYGNAAVTVTPHVDYTLTTAYNYSEDNPITLVFEITDQDTRPSSYTLQLDQFTNGRFVENGVYGNTGDSLTVTASKTGVNSTEIKYLPPADSTATEIVTFTLSKIVNGQTYYLATSVPITYTNTVSHPEYSLTTSYVYNEDQQVELIDSILDQDQFATYVLRYSQVSPVPADIYTRGTFYKAGVPQSSAVPVTLTGVKSSVDPVQLQYKPPMDYNGTIELEFYLEKTSDGVQTILANNVPVTMTVDPLPDYTLGTSYSYTENGIIDLAMNITDTDSFASSYTASFTQISPTQADNPSQFKVLSTIQAWGTDAELTSNNRSDFNLNPSFRYAVPLNYTGEIVLHVTITKVNNGTTFVLANEVPVTMTCTEVVPGIDGTLVDPLPSQLSYQRVDLTGLFSVNDGSDGFIGSVPYTGRYYGFRFIPTPEGNTPGSGFGTTRITGGNVYPGLQLQYHNYVNKTTLDSDLDNANFYLVSGANGTNDTAEFNFYRDIEYPYGTLSQPPTADATLIKTVVTHVPVADPAFNSSFQGGLYQGFSDPAVVVHSGSVETGANAHIILGAIHPTGGALCTQAPGAVLAADGINPGPYRKDGSINTIIYGGPPSASNGFNDYTIFSAHEWAYGLSTNGYSDWYLPSITELQWLYTTNPSVFAGFTWWSSTIYNSSNILYYMNADGTIGGGQSLNNGDTIYSQNHKWVAVRRIRGYKA